MPFSFHFDYEKTIGLATQSQEVLAFIKNYQSSVPQFFPGIHRFEEREPLTYYWEFDPMNYAGKSFTISFITRFEEGSSRVRIEPHSQSGNTTLQGEWEVSPRNLHSQLTLLFSLDFEVPLPSFTKSIVVPLAQSELSKLFDQYAKNLEDHFS